MPWPLFVFLSLAVGTLYSTLRIGGYEVFGPGPQGHKTQEPLGLDREPTQVSLPEGQIRVPHPSVPGYELEQVATYDIVGRVVSTRFYAFDPYREVMPIDVGLAFGEALVTRPDVKIWHGNRFLKFQYSGTWSPSAAWLNGLTNNHMIPSSRNLLRALRSIDKNDIIRMKGELVNVWHQGHRVNTTSVTREDREGGACEIIWLKSLQIGNRIYY
jgi:hypothetical protein